MYKPPFDINMEILNQAINITQKLGQFKTNYFSKKRKKENQIKSIQSSLSIEANSLSLKEVKDVIDGKVVNGSKQEIQEVKNAYNAYQKLKEFDCYKEEDLLEAHRLLTNEINIDAGRYRSCNEGVFDGTNIIFVAPPPDMVKPLMKKLFRWLKEDQDTPLLIKACVFHYEFVFIHPFSDGNGRVARLWQNAILTKWNPSFLYLPIESQIQKYQSEYYDAISNCHQNGNSIVFIEFMVKMINETLDEELSNINKRYAENISKLLKVMEKDVSYSSKEIMNLLQIKSKDTIRSSYLNPALINNLIRRTIPDKSSSKDQKYYKV